MFRITLALAAGAAAMTLAPIAPAATVITLEGEQAQGEATTGSGFASIECDETSTGTVSYQVFGTAAGPYPGTFEETGTITVSNRLPTSFSAEFTIESGDTRIEGRKTLETPIDIVCGPAAPEDFPVAEHAHGNLIARYEATITSPTGAFVDHGVAGVGISAVEFVSGLISAGLSESFISDRESSHVELTPEEAVNEVGTTHTVTARLRDGQLQPLSGQKILFAVTGSVTATGDCTTNSEGMCDFTYSGPEEPGADLITACYDFDESGTVDVGEKCVTATKVWIETIATPGATTGGGYIGSAAGGDRIAFGFNAKSDGVTVRGHCNVIDRATDTHVKCLDATLLAISGSHATFMGMATVNGIATNYRIDVDDLGEPGAGQDTFKIQTDSGYIAAGVLTGGNIQVRG